MTLNVNAKLEIDTRICVFCCGFLFDTASVVICYMRNLQHYDCFLAVTFNAFKIDVLVGCEEKHIFKMSKLANVV